MEGRRRTMRACGYLGRISRSSHSSQKAIFWGLCQFWNKCGLAELEVYIVGKPVALEHADIFVGDYC